MAPMCAPSETTHDTARTTRGVGYSGAALLGSKRMALALITWTRLAGIAARQAGPDVAHE